MISLSTDSKLASWKQNKETSRIAFTIHLMAVLLGKEKDFFKACWIGVSLNLHLYLVQTEIEHYVYM